AHQLRRGHERPGDDDRTAGARARHRAAHRDGLREESPRDARVRLPGERPRGERERGPRGARGHPRHLGRRGGDRTRAVAARAREVRLQVTLDTPLTRHAKIEVPLICGAMYPCSNVELVAAASEAGAIGIVQPVTLTFVHGLEFREGLRRIRALTNKPIGMNALIEKSSPHYLDRMKRWVEEALEDGVRFFVTSLGDPRWVAEKAHAAGGVVYHDVTEARWAKKALDGGVDGLIAVNARAGGHAGGRDPRALLDELMPFGLPVVCAGGVGDATGFVGALRMGYAGVQCGTRFIATRECDAS